MGESKMKNDRQLKTAFVLTVILVVLELLSNLWMLFGFDLFNGNADTLSVAGFRMLKFFTIDSNILMGILAAFVAVNINRVRKGNSEKLATFNYVLYLVGTTGVTLTMLVTIFFLAPTAGNRWWTLFTNANFFLHFLNPLLAIIVFAGLLREARIEFKFCIYGILPLLLYALYYVSNCMSHAIGNQIPSEYDWYGFFVLGANSAKIIVPLLALITYGISVGLWALNQKCGKKKAA